MWVSVLWPRSMLTPRIRPGRLRAPPRSRSDSRTSRESALSIVALDPKATRPDAASTIARRRSGVTKRRSWLSPTVRRSPTARKVAKSSSRMADNALEAMSRSASFSRSMKRYGSVICTRRNSNGCEYSRNALFTKQREYRSRRVSSTGFDTVCPSKDAEGSPSGSSVRRVQRGIQLRYTISHRRCTISAGSDVPCGIVVTVSLQRPPIIGSCLDPRSSGSRSFDGPAPASQLRSAHGAIGAAPFVASGVWHLSYNRRYTMCLAFCAS